MVTASRLIVLAVVAACGSEPSPGRSPREPVATTPEPPSTPAITPDARAAPPIDAAPRTLAAECAGGDLDLRALFDGDTCRSAVHVEPVLPEGIEVRVEPALRARRGAAVPSAVVLANTTAQPVEVKLPAYCPASWQIETQILDRKGRRVDLIETCGPGGGGCGGGTVTIRIEPQGRAHFGFELATRQRHQDASCEEVDAGPLPVGRYEAEITARFLQASIKAPLVIVR